MKKGAQLEDKQRWMRERTGASSRTADEQATDLDFAQRHYTTAQIANLWNLSPDAVRRLFETEPGVLILGGNQGRGRRRYTTLRIPESVVARVYRKQLSR